MKMENSQIMKKERLGFFGILKEALTIPFKNPCFIIFIFLTSLPLFYFMLTFETIFQQTLIESAKILDQALFRDCYFCDTYDEKSLLAIDRLIGKVSLKFLLLGVMYVGIIHLLDLFNTVAIVDSASLIYAGEKTMNIKDMLCRVIKESRFMGPLITSIYALLLASLIFLGLVSLAIYMYISLRFVPIAGLFGVLFLALLTKSLEWNAIWNMGIVMSVLEDKQGDVALIVSAYLSRDSRKLGLLIMLVFFVWSLALRSLCFYVRWHEGRIGLVLTAMHISLVCFGDVIKWMVFVVYTYDCKKRNSEKRIESNDVEECAAVEE